MEKFLQAVDWVNEQTGRVVSYLIIFLMLVLLYEITARYLFNSPTIWAHETSQMIYGAYVILLGGYVMKQGGHVSVDILYQRFKPRTRAIVNLCTWPLFFCFCGVLFYKGSLVSWDSLKIWETAPTSFGPPVYLMKIMLPLGALLMLLQGLGRYIKEIRLAVSPEEEDVP